LKLLSFCGIRCALFFLFVFFNGKAFIRGVSFIVIWWIFLLLLFKRSLLINTIIAIHATYMAVSNGGSSSN